VIAIHGRFLGVGWFSVDESIVGGNESISDSGLMRAGIMVVGKRVAEFMVPRFMVAGFVGCYCPE
jgi:hypothetical protein